MNNQIDFTPATHRLKDLMYNVDLVCLRTEGTEGELNLFSINQKKSLEVPGYYAVVDLDGKKVISVVSKNYQLISNSRALEMGKYAFHLLFPDVNIKDLVPYKVIAPTSKASCHIDLIHKEVKFNVWEQETWLPFLRVSNSYNRTQTLAFEIGFVRKLCSNGVLFNKKTVKVKYPHNIGQQITLNVDVEQLRPLEASFKLSCSNLKTVNIDPALLFALVCRILDIKLLLNDNKADKQIKVLKEFKDKIKQLTQIYFGSLGHNAYAALSVLTDLISHQDQYKNISGFSLNPNSYYYRAADWVIDFAEKSTNPDFSIAEYLENTINQLNHIKEETAFEWVLEIN